MCLARGEAGSAEGAGGEIGCRSVTRPEFYWTRRTPGLFYREIEALVLCLLLPPLPGPCAALST